MNVSFCHWKSPNLRYGIVICAVLITGTGVLFTQTRRKGKGNGKGNGKGKGKGNNDQIGTGTSASESESSSDEPNTKEKENNAEAVKASKEEKKKAKAARNAAFKRLVMVAKPDTFRITLGLSALVVNSITNLSFPAILGMAIDHNKSKDGENSNFIIKSTAFFLCGSISSWIRVYCLGTATDRIASRLRKELFDSYMDTEMELHNTELNGEMLTLLEKDVDTAAEGLTEKLSAGIRSLNSSINGSISLFQTSPKLCGVALASVPCVGVGAMILSKHSRKLAEKLRNLQSTITTYSLERFSSFSTVKLSGRQEYEKDKYADFMKECLTISENKNYWQGGFMSFINIATNTSLFLVLHVGGHMINSGVLTAGALTKFAIQSAFVGLGFSGLATFSSDMTKALSAAQRVFDAIDANTKNLGESTGSSSSTSSSTASSSSSRTNTSSSTSSNINTSTSPQPICFHMDSVGFTYKTRPNMPVLKNISLRILPNCITCFRGSSGTGKSTLLALLSGLYQPTTGSIRALTTGPSIEDCSVSIKQDKQYLSRHIGVVEQHAGTQLLSGTIAFNISYGSQFGATQDEIERAAQQAAAHEFIMALPEGYDTQVGQGGGLLSGGQRMRIAIARALVKDPSCLLLDEATGSLDSVCEQEVIDVLQGLRVTKTIVIASHSPAMVAIADTVLTMNDGSLC